MRPATALAMVSPVPAARAERPDALVAPGTSATAATAAVEASPGPAPPALALGAATEVEVFDIASCYPSEPRGGEAAVVPVEELLRGLGRLQGFHRSHSDACDRELIAVAAGLMAKHGTSVELVYCLYDVLCHPRSPDDRKREWLNFIGTFSDDGHALRALGVRWYDAAVVRMAMSDLAEAESESDPLFGAILRARASP